MTPQGTDVSVIVRRLSAVESLLARIDDRTRHVDELPVFGASGALIGPGIGLKGSATISFVREAGTGLLIVSAAGYGQFVNVPDAGPTDTIVAGVQQGNIFHSGPTGFTAKELHVDAGTAPGASGLPVTWQYGDIDLLDGVATWTEIATLTLSSALSTYTLTMTNAAVPANRLVRTNWGTIVGTPKKATTTLVVTFP